MSQPTFFFGRERELEELRRASATHRVVTVCGPAGVGKTALVRTFARDAGATVVDLTDVTADEPLEAALADALGVSFSPDADVKSQRRALATVLPHEQAIVLDNAEHLSASVLQFVDDEQLVAHRFVVASRGRLHGADEHFLQLDPFSTEGDTPTALGFLEERAALLGGTHQIREEEQAAALELVRRLDGLPLALELAAARLNLLRPAQLLDRLERSADVLSGTGVRSLESAITTSWDAASAAEQRALTSLAVLDGPFDPALGEAVIGDGGLDLMQQLRDRSLIVTDNDGRLRLLLAIRDFARARVDSEVEAEAIAHLARYLGELAPRWIEAATLLAPLHEIRHLRAHGRHLVRATDTTAEQERTACTLAIAEIALLEGRPESALNRLLTLDNPGDAVWLAIGRLQRECGRYEEADSSLAHVSNADALGERSLNAMYRGELDFARKLAQQAGEAASNDLERGRAASQLAGVAFHSGEYDEAKEGFELAIRHAHRAGDQRTEARALQNLGVVHTDQMRLDLARKCLNEAIQRHQLAGDALREAWGHNSLGVVELRAHDLAAGVAALERAGRVFDRIGHRSGAASALANLAMIAVDSQQWDDAVRYSLDAIERGSSEEDAYIVGMSKLCLTLSTWFRGDKDAAGRHFRDFEETIDRDGHVQLALSWDAAFGAYLAATGQPMAADVFDRAEALLGEDEGHDAYRDMLRLARCHIPLRALNAAEGARENLELEIFSVVTGIRAERTESLRFTLRLLRHEAPATWDEALERLSEASPTELLVSTRNAAYRPPAGEWQSLAKSPSIWRLFDALAEARRSESGPLSQDELQEAIWPGELLTPESAANRLHVSLSKLRKAGLKGVVVRDERGYFIEPTVNILFC